MRPRISIALLSEDASEGSWQGLRALVEKLFRRFEDDGHTPRIEIHPVPEARRAMVANQWRSRSARDEVANRTLWRYIARKIAEPGGFVLFHYDGDCTWSSRATWTAGTLFEDRLRLHVRRVLLDSKRSEEEANRLLLHLIDCVPFYSLEAWTFQATDVAISLCNSHYAGADVGTFHTWKADRTLLDNVHKPKDQVRLRDKHNSELGRHVPIGSVMQAGQSLMWFRWKLSTCPQLDDALVDS